MNSTEEKSEKIGKIIQMVDKSEISSTQNVVSGIINVISDPDSSAKDLNDIIQIDPPLTARVLKAANSAYYASPRKISEIQHAVIWIGFDIVNEIVLSQKVCEVFNQDETISGYSGISLWKHSVAVALLGKMICRREFGERGENAYVAGLLHDIGIIVENQFLDNDFNTILCKANQEQKNLHTIEYELLGFSHTDIGKMLTEHWGFPQELSIAMENHHNPDEAPPEFSRFASTLYIADYLCQERDIGYCDAPSGDSDLFQRCLERLDVKGYALDLIVNDVEQEIAMMEDHGLF
jgi:putative nucleotidyltransferase with HDIG domain